MENLAVNRKLKYRGIEISCDPKHSVAAWLREILAKTPKGSLQGVLVRLVASLFIVRGRPANADPKYLRLQSAAKHEAAKFNFGCVSYYVAGALISAHIRTCKQDLQAKRFPVLLVLEKKVREGYQLARRAGIEQHLAIFGLEGFFAQALLFRALELGRPIIDIWRSVLGEYNHGIETTSIPPISYE